MPAPDPRERRAEIYRLLLLAAVAVWLLHPFATGRLIGGGDALWYANMLADFVIQLRAGVFPVFAGQTQFNFIGGVFPLRVAPLYQHLGGVIDLLTGHRLGFFALQHLSVIACGVGGLYTCYFALAAIAQNRRWAAAALAIIYLGCPGVLAIIYTQDLYMSWMTVPIAPLAAYGMVRTFQRDDFTSQLWLAAPLAALWWAHSPIGLWMTGIATLVQSGRLLLLHRRTASWFRAFGGAGAFAVLVQYPFVSVHFIHTPGMRSAVTDTLPHLQKDILSNIHAAFPATLLPVSGGAMALSDLQLGYSLWAVLVLGIVASCILPKSVGRLALRLLLACSVLLLLLLLPVPGITDPTWSHLPDIVKRITNYWPMQRFYLILAILLAFAGQLALTARSRLPKSEAVLYAGLCLACGWSLWEARKFVEAGRVRTASVAKSALAQRSENLVLSDHSYGLFSALPSHFSNGVMDPQSEVRLLPNTPTADEAPAARAQARGAKTASAGALHGNVDVNPGILDLFPSMHLKPGRHYELRITFGSRKYQGILQLVGGSLFREYALPLSGEPLGFGSESTSSHAIPLWTTDPAGDDVDLHFIPISPGARTEDFADFGSYILDIHEPSQMPVQITSLMPFRATVRSREAGWLESIRMFMPGYLATVDNHPVPAQPSPDGLVMIPVVAGTHVVELRYVGPIALRVSYWSALLAWVIVFFFAGFFLLARSKLHSLRN